MTRIGRARIWLLPAALAACSQPEPAPAPAAPTAAPAATGPAATGRLSFEEARRLFDARGVQPGQPLPALQLVDLDGQPADVRALQGDKPLVLVTCSLTCNVARRRQPDVQALREQLGDRAAVVMVYTIDAHPKGDPCPYTGSEWVPADNERDGVLVRQPTSLAERLVLARRYSQDVARGTLVLVDTIDDASWRALGEAPNVGLVVDRDGVVQARSGWFESAAIRKALAPR
jgi:hypothetical protein